MATITTIEEKNISQASVEISSAQIIANTIITLAPAPGAGFKIVPIGQPIIELNFNTTAFTGTGVVVIGSGGGGSNWFSIGSIFLNNSISLKNLMDQNTVSTNRINQNQSLICGTGGAIATGDGTLTITMNYSIIAT